MNTAFRLYTSATSKINCRNILVKKLQWYYDASIAKGSDRSFVPNSRGGQSYAILYTIKCKIQLTKKGIACSLHTDLLGIDTRLFSI